jgi:hypothetical protein
MRYVPAIAAQALPHRKRTFLSNYGKVTAIGRMCGSVLHDIMPLDKRKGGAHEPQRPASDGCGSTLVTADAMHAEYE